MGQLEGKVALIAGAAGGQWRSPMATVEALKETQRLVVGLDRRVVKAAAAL